MKNLYLTAFGVLFVASIFQGCIQFVPIEANPGFSKTTTAAEIPKQVQSVQAEREPPLQAELFQAHVRAVPRNTGPRSDDPKPSGPHAQAGRRAHSQDPRRRDGSPARPLEISAVAAASHRLVLITPTSQGLVLITPTSQGLVLITPTSQGLVLITPKVLHIQRTDDGRQRTVAGLQRGIRRLSSVIRHPSSDHVHSDHGCEKDKRL